MIIFIMYKEIDINQLISKINVGEETLSFLQH